MAKKKRRKKKVRITKVKISGIIQRRIGLDPKVQKLRRRIARLESKKEIRKIEKLRKEEIRKLKAKQRKLERKKPKFKLRRPSIPRKKRRRLSRNLAELFGRSGGLPI